MMEEIQARPLHSLLGNALRNQEFEENVRKLQDLVRRWGSIVGSAAKNSAPYELKGGTLFVAARSPHTVQRVEQMRGNIQRALKDQWGLDIQEVRVTLGSPPVRPKTVTGLRRHRVPVEPAEEEVRAFRDQCPESLPAETAEALARLRAFFLRRFGT
ncbi:MAG: DUF721 domain-containing protein [Synergistaceae bacterium]|nr:DUF721 domain-containing protein [Synergistaceae bacterium]